MSLLSPAPGRPTIESCHDPARLKEWALAASDLSDAEFLKLVEA